jgi:L-lactate dehydrogenase
MKSPIYHTRKVTIVGAGAVGSTFAYALMQAGIAEEIAILDKDTDQAEGQVLDLAHGLQFTPQVSIHTATPEDYADSQVIVITAGAKQKPDESRLNLLKRNRTIIQSIMDDIMAQNSQAIVVIVSNPVDILTHIALEHSGWPRERIIGSGTVLDSARFRYLLGKHCGVNSQNVHSYILGEHGDSEVAAWSLTHIGGVPMNDYCKLCGQCGGKWREHREDIAEQVRQSAYHIIGYKGATYFAVGLALVRIVQSILRNEHSVLTVSIRLQGEYDIDNVTLSVPCLVAAGGIERIIDSDLADNELEALKKSAAVLRKKLDDLDGASPE